MKSVLAATVDNGESIPKEGEATYGARQPISLQTAPTKRSRFLIKKIFSNWQTHKKWSQGGRTFEGMTLF
jgi:hypothetical protein